MQPNYDYSNALETLHKLLQGARNASDKGKYEVLGRIIHSAEKISERLLDAKDRFELADTASQKLNKHFVDSFKSMSDQQQYIRVLGEII